MPTTTSKLGCSLATAACAMILVAPGCGDSDTGMDAAVDIGAVLDVTGDVGNDARESEDGVAPDRAVDTSPDASADVSTDRASDVAPDVPAVPFPPPELEAEPDPQPTGDGWRTAQWNICTTRMDGGRLECRARIRPEDSTRTAVELERAAIAQYFLNDANMYSFTLQEVCEQDVRWIAAFVATGGPPRSGFRSDFADPVYSSLEESAPYAFLPYLTHEMVGDRDLGCGEGVSTGIAAIAKRTPGTTGFLTYGLTTSSYEDREGTGLTAAQLRSPAVCASYFQAQTSYGPVDSGTDQYESVFDFRTGGCASTVPDTLRGLACVRTRWRGPGDAEDRTYRVTTCASHAVHRGTNTWRVRNHQIRSAAVEMFALAGGTDQRVILSGDWNVVANRGASATVDSAERGHNTILSEVGMGKVTIGDHLTSSRTGTLRVSASGLECGREIDAIYARNAWWLESPAPNASTCRDYGEEEAPGSLPGINPYDWSDHEMMVSPLMSPHGTGPADL